MNELKKEDKNTLGKNNNTTGCEDQSKLISENVLRQFYSQKDENGQPIENGQAVLDRVKKIAENGMFTQGDKVAYDTFCNLLDKKVIVPSSPILMNGSTNIGQLSACFVLPLEDSMEDIYETLKNSALVHKSGGGTGFNFSNIRGEGQIVNSTGGVASGPLSFMQVFNSSTDTIKQGGKRRGANMACLSVEHIDIEKFIQCKQDLTQYNNFNISVAVTDDFMKALDGRSTLSDRFSKETIHKAMQECNVECEEFCYQITKGLGKSKTGLIVKDARKVMKLIVDCAWKTGEPGLLFRDRINAMSPTIEEIESTNPCGEIPLLPNEACNLSAINLNECCDKETYESEDSEGNPITAYRYTLNITRLSNAAYYLTGFLNAVIDVNKLPLAEIDTMVKKYRKLGIGTMGFADMLYKLRIPYGSDESLELAKAIQMIIAGVVKRASSQLYKQYKWKMLSEGNNSLLQGYEDIWATTPDDKKGTGSGSGSDSGTGSGTGSGSVESKGNEGALNGNTEDQRIAKLRAYKASIVNARKEYEQYVGFSEEFKNKFPHICNMAEDEFENEFVENAEVPVLNYCRLTAAPTGTTSIFANTSGGIEPNFALVYYRLMNGTDYYKMLNPVFKEWLETNTDVLEKMSINEVMDDLLEKGSILKCDWADKETKRVFVCSQDISSINHIRMMSAFQDFIDNSVSKTINLSNDATREDVKEAYLLADNRCLKGITVYRDGCRANQVLSTKHSDAGSKGESGNTGSVNEAEVKMDDRIAQKGGAEIAKASSESEKDSSNAIDTITKEAIDSLDKYSIRIPRKRSTVMEGKTVVINTGCGKLYTTVNSDKYGLAEVFSNTGTSGGCEAQSVALSKVISIALRCGVDPEEIRDQLMGVRCPSAIANENSQCISCPDAIGRSLDMVLKEMKSPKLISKKKSKDAQVDTSEVMKSNDKMGKVAEGSTNEAADAEMHTISVKNATVGKSALGGYEKCPKCGERLPESSRCVTCSCGWSKCM